MLTPIVTFIQSLARVQKPANWRLGKCLLPSVSNTYLKQLSLKLIVLCQALLPQVTIANTEWYVYLAFTFRNSTHLNALPIANLTVNTSAASDRMGQIVTTFGILTARNRFFGVWGRVPTNLDA